MNDFVKPKDQREFIRFGLARNRTFKKGFSPCFFVHEFHEFTRITKRLDNGDLIGRTNFH